MERIEQESKISIYDFGEMYDKLSQKNSASEEEILEFLKSFDHLEDNHIDWVRVIGREKSLEIIDFLKKIASVYGERLNFKLEILNRKISKIIEKIR